jgi:hypothetical protein
VTIYTPYLGLELVGEALERFALRRVFGSKRRAEVIEGEIDVVQRVTDFVSDGSG